MLVVKYYSWDCDKQAFVIKVVKAKAIYSQDENRLLAEEPDSTVLLDIGVHQLISVYAMKEGE